MSEDISKELDAAPGSAANNSNGNFEHPAEITVPCEIVQDWFARGLLELTPEQIDQLSNGPTIKLARELVDALQLSDNRRPVKKGPVEWMDPIDAVHSLAPFVGGDSAAKLVIAERLRDDAIDCSCLWMADEPDVGPISRSRPRTTDHPSSPGTALSVSPIPKKPGMIRMGGAFVRMSDDWDRDLKRWDWASGLFVVSRRQPVLKDEISVGDVLIRTVVSRVRFDRADIERIVEARASSVRGDAIPSPEITEEPAKEGNARGRPRKTEWLNWVAEVAAYIRWEGIEHETNPLDFYDEIKSRLLKRKVPCPKYKTVESAISAVKARVVEEEVDRARTLQSCKAAGEHS